jgi:very-short-patch-repair endonuclease
VSEVPPNLPQPIIFGPDRPHLTMVMRQGTTRPESRTNQNLYLQPWDFDEKGTYSMGAFLLSREECAAIHSKHGCPGVVWEHRDGEAGVIHYDAPTPPDYDKCPGVRNLKSYCGSHAEAVFFRHYCLANNFGSYHDYCRYYDDTLKEWRAHSDPDATILVLAEHEAEFALRARLTFPALIPQVWLNVIPPGNRTLAEEQRLAREPQRVDFLMIAEGRKCIIEIDGPSHYAEYDEAGSEYSVSEERYTFNLRVERSLRTHGFEVYRFSNFEVENTPLDEFRELIKHLPGRW